MYARTDGTAGGSTAGSILLMIGGIWALVGIGLRFLYAGMTRCARAEQEVFETGTRATAVVESVETTDTVSNNINVRIVVRLRVQPRSEPEFAYQRRMYVPFNGMPRTGDVIDVAYDPDDTSQVELATDWLSDTGGGRLLMFRHAGEEGATPAGRQSGDAAGSAYRLVGPDPAARVIRNESSTSSNACTG